METESALPAILGVPLVAALVISVVAEGGCWICLPILLAVATIWTLGHRSR